MRRIYFEAVDHLKNQQPRSLQQIHSGISPDLVEVVEKCLTLDPASRPSAMELASLPVFDEIRSKHEWQVVAKPVSIKIDVLQIVAETRVVKDYPVESLRGYLVRLVEIVGK